MSSLTQSVGSMRAATDNAIRAVRSVVGGVKFAMAHALRQNALRRVRTPDPEAEALPGYRAGRTSHIVREEILERLNALGGPDLARECSWVLCEVGSIPSPLGVPSTNSAKRIVTPVIGRVIRAVRWMARRHYRERKYRSLSIPKKSSMGFPYFISGPDALPLRTAYFRSYEKFLPYIREHLEQQNWTELASGKRYLPIYTVMTVNYRLQPQQAKDVSFSGDGRLAQVGWKERIVMDAAGAFRTMDTSIRGWKNGSTHRGRSINQISATGAMLGQANEDPYRCAYYGSCELFEIPDIPARARRLRDEFPDANDFVFGSFDFHAMEKSCDDPIWTSGIIAGMRDANCSESFVQLTNALHFGAYLIGEDDYRRRPAHPVTLHGSVLQPSRLNDLGHRSGEPGTDTHNKDLGVAVYALGIFETGGFGPQANYYHTFEEFMNEFGDRYVLQGRRVPEARYAIAGNCGDDCLTGGDRKYRDALAEWLHTLAPYFEVDLEKDTQFLGNTCANDGSSYPYMGKFYSNFLSPERSWDSKMRRDFWPLGVFARLEHFSAHPEFLEHKKILNLVCKRHWGVTPYELAEQASLSRAIPRNFNLAEMIFLHDPTTISWGRVKREDIRDEVFDAVDFYLNISPERVEALTL